MEELTKALEPLLIQLTAMIEMLTELVGSLIDNPIGIIILLFVIPTILSFCFGVFGTIFEIIVGTISMVMEIVFLIFCKLPIKGYKLVKRVSSKKKKVKTTIPEQDLADSLKSNTLDP